MRRAGVEHGFANARAVPDIGPWAEDVADWRLEVPVVLN